MHDAGIVIAMAQVKRMPQFVKDLFNNPIFEFFFDICNRKAFL